MSKEIKDFLHLYLNYVDVIIDTVRDDFKSHFGHAPGHKTQLGPILYAVILEGGVTVKPILRDLSDMTEEESAAMRKLFSEMANEDKSQGEIWADQTLHMLKHGFDLFGLLPAGLAINAKDLKQ